MAAQIRYRKTDATVRVELDNPVAAAGAEDAGADMLADAHAIEQQVAGDFEVVGRSSSFRQAHRRCLGQAAPSCRGS